jgi:hypothetical protein
MMFSIFSKRCTRVDLDAAVRDGAVIQTLPWIVVLAGFLVGVTMTVFLPILLLYGSCILEPAAVQGHLPENSPYPNCAVDAPWRRSAVPWLWPWMMGALGATYGMVRKMDLAESGRWLPPYLRIRPFHLLACTAGYMGFVSLAFASGSWILLRGSPLLAVLSGPAIVLIWQFLHDRLLLLIGHPEWEELVAATARLWLARSLALPQEAITEVRAHKDGLLEVVADIEPRLADRIQSLAMQLPGVHRVRLCDPAGSPIIGPKEPARLTSAVAAARSVAELRRARTEMFASPSYKPRRVIIHDYSGRALIITTAVIITLMMAALTWMGRRGGFKRITAEEIQWFYGKYGPGAPASVRKSIPKSLRPPDW